MTFDKESMTILPDVIKGDADWRQYHSIQLPNGVRCVFVNDKESKTTACSVCVGAGASSDPRELSGLAHFTEHMCFLGSEAYPVENEFKKYLSSHGGRSNASTAMSQTTYKFDILSEHAEKAIDIFSNFFVSPLFTQSGTDRELNAVDSENSKNMSNDGRRRLQILKALANPQHHYSKFSTGDARTLAMITEDNDNGSDNNNDQKENQKENGDTVTKNTFVREALLAFHRRHYRPDNLVVVVVGPQDIETLQEWIVPKFEKIIDRWEVKDESEMSKAELFVDTVAKDAPNDTFGSPPVPYDPPFCSKFQSNTWPIILTTLPLQSVRKMYIYFQLPSVKQFHDQSPYHIITNLLGHEGPGSCFALLQDAELVDTMSAGPRLSEVDHSLLQINISLTEKGEEHWEDVVSTIFDYCRLLYDTAKTAKEEERSGKGESDETSLKELTRVWDEVQKIKSLRFHQTSPGQAYSLAPSLASSVRRNGTARSMSIGSLLNERKDTLPLDNVLDFLKKMTPQNCFIEHCSQSAWEKQTKNDPTEVNNQVDPSLFGIKKEKWYGVNYHLSPIYRDVVKRWDWNKLRETNKSLYLPSENKYIPTDLSLSSDLPEDATKEPRIDKEIEPPKLVIHDKDFGRLWHRLDDRYCLPKASLTLLLRNAATHYNWEGENASWSFDSNAGIQTGILMDVFSDALAQTTYDASLAGIYWSFTKSPSGLVLKCSGYSQHLTSFASQILKQFFAEKGTFINDKHVRTNKDRMVRHLKSYLISHRADNYASYYTSLLMSSRGLGIDNLLSSTQAVSLESIQAHHQLMVSLGSTKVECLVSGNISEKDAKHFFKDTREIINKAKAACVYSNQLNDSNKDGFNKCIPGPFNRVLEKGEDIHLHFQSQNPEEQNGAVRMTFQSPTPGFKGFESPSMKDTLNKTAALRALCHMLREPLFNQLRTKEQLGYIVNSHYDIDFSSQSGGSDQALDDSSIYGTVPINSIVVNVLSRKVPPPVLTQRIDEFLHSFRDKLLEMPEEEIRNHKDALSKKLRKPIQKLVFEVDDHFTKIRRYSPEVFDQNKSNDHCPSLPWDSKKHLAAAIEGLNRQDLLHAWDSVVTGKDRSRVVSHIYGSSFKMNSANAHNSGLSKDKVKRNIIHINSERTIFEKRKALVPFQNAYQPVRLNGIQSIVRQLGKKKVAIAGIAAGASLFLYAMNMSRTNRTKTKK